MQRDRGEGDGNVDEEDPLPAEEVREDTAEQNARGGAEATDGPPDSERDVALAALAEGRRQNRESGRGDDRGPEALKRPGGDQRRLAPREPCHERPACEQPQPDEEDAPATEQVGGTPPEQEEAPEDECVGADHPLQVLLREPEVDLDRGKSDVDDCDVEDDHELDDAEKGEGPPFAICRSSHRIPPFGVIGDESDVTGCTFNKQVRTSELEVRLTEHPPPAPPAAPTVVSALGPSGSRRPDGDPQETDLSRSCRPGHELEESSSSTATN